MSKNPPNAFAEEEPRTDRPPRDHKRGDFPASLRTKWNSAKAGGRDVALASNKKAEAEDPRPKVGALRLPTRDIWDDGPLYDARLNTVAQVIFKQRASAIFLRGLSREGIQILRKTQMWNRLRLSDLDFPNNDQRATALVLNAAGDTAITDIEMSPIDIVANPGILFRVTTGSAGSVLVALARYRFSRPLGEAPAPEALVAPTSEYIRWAASALDRVYVSNRRGSAPDETGGGAPFDS